MVRDINSEVHIPNINSIDITINLDNRELVLSFEEAVALNVILLEMFGMPEEYFNNLTDD